MREEFTREIYGLAKEARKEMKKAGKHPEAMIISPGAYEKFTGRRLINCGEIYGMQVMVDTTLSNEGYIVGGDELERIESGDKDVRGIRQIGGGYASLQVGTSGKSSESGDKQNSKRNRPDKSKDKGITGGNAK